MIDKLKQVLNEYFIGKEDVTENLLICLLAGGHVLLEDVPGVGKTTLARTLAKAVSLDFGRIQFTPDTLPSDVTGVSVLNMKTGEFEYREGAVLHQIILADEINRTSPKTQASLLEAMAEGQVSVDGVSRALSPVFMVAATQNPIESYGTFPLPEAQMDRFMMRMKLGYMSRGEEIGVALRKDTNDLIAGLRQVVTAEETLALRAKLDEVEISEPVIGYIMDIVGKTRNDDRFNIGASPRGTIALCKMCRAFAAFHGRTFVTPDDVKTLAPYVLAHRLYYRTAVGSAEAEELFRGMLREIPVPTEE